MKNFQDVMDQFGALRERLSEPGVPNHLNPAHLSFAARVLLIMRQLDRPVWPKLVTVEYESRNWPPPRGGTTYDAVNAAMSYLLHRKKLLGKGEEGYFIAPTTLSEQIGGEKAGGAARA